MLKELKVLKTITMSSASATDTVEIPRVFVARKWQLRLKATVTNTTLSSGQTYGSVVTNAPATLLQRIDLRVVGGNKANLIKSVSGEDLLNLGAYIHKGSQENQSNVPTGTTSVTAGDTISYASLDLDFGCPDTQKLAFQTEDKSGNPIVPKPYKPEHLTLLDPQKYDPVELIITWGSLANLASGYTAGTLTLSSAEVKVVANDLPDMAGNFMVNREIYKETPITGASTDMRIDLPKGNLIRRVLIQAMDNSAWNNSIVNNVKVVVNENTIRYDAGFNQIRNENSKTYGIPYASLLTGMAIVDFDDDQDFKGLLDVTDVDNVRLSLDVNSPTGTAKIRLVIQEITP